MVILNYIIWRILTLGLLSNGPSWMAIFWQLMCIYIDQHQFKKETCGSIAGNLRGSWWRCIAYTNIVLQISHQYYYSFIGLFNLFIIIYRFSFCFNVNCFTQNTSWRFRKKTKNLWYASNVSLNLTFSQSFLCTMNNSVFLFSSLCIRTERSYSVLKTTNTK